jgi:hypothetical protein
VKQSFSIAVIPSWQDALGDINGPYAIVCEVQKKEEVGWSDQSLDHDEADLRETTVRAFSFLTIIIANYCPDSCIPVVVLVILDASVR